MRILALLLCSVMICLAQADYSTLLLLAPPAAGGGGGFTQIQTQGNDSDTNGFASFNANQLLSSSFTTSTADTITKVRIRMRRVGSPTYNFQIKLYTDSGGSGFTMTQVGVTSAETVAASSITTAIQDLDFTFSPGLSVSSATRYHFVGVADGFGDASNCLQWAGNPSGTESQWRAVVDFSNMALVQGSMDGCITTFKSP